MKLTIEQKQVITEEFTTFKNKMYAGKTKKERNTLGQFFTPAPLTIQILEKLNCSYEEFISSAILDPTSGSGNLLAAALLIGANPKNVYGNEIDDTMVGLCRERLNAICDSLNKPHIQDHQIFCADALGPLALQVPVDYIIANVPYGRVGANIVQNIIKTIDYKEFILLLPANDYKRNKDKDLFNYQSDMVAINNGFEDAAVTTHLARIHKVKVNNLTAEEFERSQYLDRSLDKYFEETYKRPTDFKVVYKPSLEYFETVDMYKSIYIAKRDVVNKHLAYSKACNAYRWNVLEDMSKQEVLENNAKSEQALGNAGDFILIVFDNVIKKKNLVNFMYSATGFKFIAKLFTSMNKDSYISPAYYLPKVDYEKEITVTGILTDYKYTIEEISAIIKTLIV